MNQLHFNLKKEQNKAKKEKKKKDYPFKSPLFTIGETKV